MPANLQPAMAKGTVTAVNDDNITLQTTEDTTITVNTDADTVIKDDNGDIAAQSDIEIGMSAKLLGLWDSVLNVFNAFKIKLS